MTGNNDTSCVDAKNGYITIDVVGGTPHSYIVRSKRDDAVSVELDLQYEGMVDLRTMLWDAMRKQGRGTEISIEKVLQIEEVRHKGRYSVAGYEEEIRWTIDLLKRHLDRVAAWKDTPAKDRAAYGKLDEFLSEFVE